MFYVPDSLLGVNLVRNSVSDPKSEVLLKGLVHLKNTLPLRYFLDFIYTRYCRFKGETLYFQNRSENEENVHFIEVFT